ncbi:MAG: adenylyltransferase [Lacrimispora sp.]|jgi:aminoglycoside 6-adenylyltransferase|nr:adenylyltransferase [Lacrimispora sp.]
MRSEKEMYELILGTAHGDDRIRGVYMGGSRTNPNAVPDLFQDYDVVYIVKETESFIKDTSWIDQFGDRLFMQYPDENPAYPHKKDESYGWLMQFSDGNRLDLHVMTLDCAIKDICTDQLCTILMDKDDILPAIPESSDKSHWVSRPSEIEFLCICNEFWWCLDNVAKGLWRNEIPYVQDMLSDHIRPQLVTVLSWKVGIITDFSCSIGKSGKYMHRWLSQDEWESFLKTYADGEADHIWEAVMRMCNLFHETAGFVSGELGFLYETMEASNCMVYLKHVRKLPPDAKQVY